MARVTGFSRRLMERYAEGTRVRFVEDVERYPHFIVPKGATAVVVDVQPTLIVAHVDQHVDGLTDSEWEGDFCYYIEDAEDWRFTPVEVLT